MSERILIYEKNREILTFLKSFFRKRRKSGVEFVQTLASLKEALSTDSNNCIQLCIVSADELQNLSPLEGRPSIIATIPPNTQTGFKTIMKYGAENYLISPFHEGDLEFKIKNVLDRRQMVGLLKKETDNLQALIELTYLVSSTLDPQEIFYLIVKKISEVIPVTRCSIIRVDSDKRYAHVVSTFETPLVKNIKLDLSKYPEIKKALVSREPVVIKDVTTDPLLERLQDIISPLGIRSIVVIPIIFHEEVIGTLFLRTSRAGYAFTENEIRLCNAIANVSANSLYNAFLFEKLESEKLRFEKLAITDFLTGAYNIRYFYHRLQEEFSRSERYALPLSCLMIDIDHFKEINDKFGHRTGDTVLREFAQVLKKHTRKSDVLARYGGEEFIMLLTQTTETGAVSKAEAMRSYIENYKFRSLKGRKGPTVSIGVASFPNSRIKTNEQLITFSDNALYRAKTTGRNQVALYGNAT
ncbi:MAG TPA: sensor domain-containing diguanylate cyclase [Thermodesulfovibrionales bacterium]|nr:sensor domain-containing diguanylate cyclase [Thermodesulfovibrionales bacterium]